ESDAPSGSSTHRPPTKRARKAINCAPCRTSKLKCDKARPCSSCVLRGTASQCYSDGKDESSHRRNGIDPHNEIARMRQSLATLEAYVIRGSRSSDPHAPGSAAASARTPLVRDGSGGSAALKLEQHDADLPGVLAEKGRGGFYAGPTSTATLLFSLKAGSGAGAREGSAEHEHEHDASGSGGGADSDFAGPTDVSRGFDDDLLAALPAIHVIDGLVDYYLSFCNWMYRHVHPPAFAAAWARFKACASADRLVLATLAAVMAVAVRYLPARHALLAALAPPGSAAAGLGGAGADPDARAAVGERFYGVACAALARYRAESRTLSLELVELLLLRTHYLTLSKDESEEIWALRGELVSIGTALGLHRDPDKWRMPRALADRRRWAWWHVILLERWQCFLFGRPLSVAAHHFDTRMPAALGDAGAGDGGDPRMFLPNITMFRLADILGDIVDDAVSIRPVPYARVLALDKALVAWMEDLPPELDLDEYRLARALASPIPADMRLGVLSVLVRTSFYHIRFTLHRPYATAPAPTPPPAPAPAQNHEHHARTAQALDTAASAADRLIQLVAQATPASSPSSLSPDGGAAGGWVGSHTHWGPFHCFSAAMFFALQLAADPAQPGAGLFRANVRRVRALLARARGVPIADKAGDMLAALAPLYDPADLDSGSGPGSGFEYGGEGGGGGGGEARRAQVIALVKSLAFPYHDSSTGTRSQHASPRSSAGSAGSPGTLRSAFPADPHMQQHQHQHQQLALAPAPPYSRAPPPQQQQQLSGLVSPSAGMDYFGGGGAGFAGGGVTPGLPTPPPSAVAGGGGTGGGEDVAMWGASVGFGQGEWARFLDVMQRTEASGLMSA
ncbi:hypothetical protein DFH11DRAFT_1836297, partial [Phellopilus nigrolimitatus]